MQNTCKRKTLEHTLQYTTKNLIDTFDTFLFQFVQYLSWSYFLHSSFTVTVRVATLVARHQEKSPHHHV